MSPNIQEHYKSVQKVLILVLVLNWAVALAKLIYGLATKCSSMTADGFHSFADGASNIIGLIGLKFCSKPADSDHPYGHKKYETLFALGIAGLLFTVTFQLFEEGIKRFHAPVIPEVNPGSFAVMILTILVNVAVMVYEYRKGRELGSDILTADSMHTRADLFTSCSVIVAIIAIRCGAQIVDPIVTLLISGFIAFAAIQIIRQEAGILCDAAAITNIGKIEKAVLAVKGVKGCHKIRSRGRPDDIHIDLHVQLDPATHLDKAHNTSYLIEEAIKQAISGTTDVVVHLEPLEKGAK